MAVTINGTTGISKLGGVEAENFARRDAANVFTLPQKLEADGASPLTDGTLDLSTKNNFVYAPSGADTLEFSNETADAQGLIFLDNTSGHTITLGTEVQASDELAASISEAGTYILSYWCYDGANVAMSFAKVG